MFITDTNFLMKDYKNIELIESDIIIPITVIHELDNHKNDKGSVGYNTRKSLRKINDAIDNDYTLKNGFKLTIDEDEYENISKNDNKIIESALNASDSTLVTGDVGMKIVAMSRGIKVMKSGDDDDVLNPGKVEELVIDYELLQDLFSDGKISYADVKHEKNYENACFMVRDENKTGSALIRRIGNFFIRVKQPKKIYGKITGRNIAQRLYLDMLMDKRIKIILVNGVAGCVDKDTEYFNGSEWKCIDKYVDGESVLQYNSDGKSSLIIPQQYHVHDADYLWHFKTKYGLDQCLSDEHNVIYQTSRGNLGKRKFSEVKDMHEKSLHGFSGKFITTFDHSGAGIDMSENDIKIMLAVIADSHFPPNNTNRCVIRLKKNRKKDEIRKLLVEGDYEFSETDAKPDGFTRFGFDAPRKEKSFESYWYNCSKRQLEIVCNNVLKWDGSIAGSRKSFSTCCKKTADFVQFAFSACGYRSSISMHDRVGKALGKYVRKSVEYHISITDRTLVGVGRRTDIGKEKMGIDKYKTIDGKKYCFTVDTGMLVLRRNGKIFITGNSGKTLLALAAACQLKESKKFEEIICAKSVEEIGKEIGFRPGEEESKLQPYYAAFNDNLEFLAKPDARSGTLRKIVPDVTYEHIGYMRGRTFRDSFMLFDECQNLSPEIIKSIISRAGEGSKVVCCGDLKQIDNNQSEYTNGLFHAQRKLIGNEMVGVITLEKSERSDIAKLCALL